MVTKPTQPPLGSPGSRRPTLTGLLRRGAAALALLALSSGAYAAGTVITVSGSITGGASLLNPVWNEAKEKDAHRYTFRQPSPTVAPGSRVLSGYLPKELCITALGEKGAPNSLPLRVVVEGGRTTPVTLVIAQGQQILFENRDPFPHRIYDTGGKGLLAGDMQPTKTRAWTPPGPGKYEIRDETAPSLRSWIVVEPRTVAVAYPNRKGEFNIELEPGSYTLRGYFNGEPVGKELPVIVNLGPPRQPLRAPLELSAKPSGSAP